MDLDFYTVANFTQQLGSLNEAFFVSVLNGRFSVGIALYKVNPNVYLSQTHVQFNALSLFLHMNRVIPMVCDSLFVLSCYQILCICSIYSMFSFCTISKLGTILLLLFKIKSMVEGRVAV